MSRMCSLAMWSNDQHGVNRVTVIRGIELGVAGQSAGTAREGCLDSSES